MTEEEREHKALQKEAFRLIYQASDAQLVRAFEILQRYSDVQLAQLTELLKIGLKA